MYLHPRLLSLAVDVRWRIVISAIVGMMAVTAGVARLAVAALIIVEVVRGNATFESLTWPVVGMAALIVARVFLQYLQEVMSHHTASLVKVKLRERLYEHSLALGPGYFDASRTGDALMSLAEGVERLEAFFGRYLPQMIVAAVAPVVIFIFMALIDFRTGLVFLGFALLTLVIPNLFHRWNRERSMARRDAYGALGADFLDAVQGLATLKAFGQSRMRGELLADRARDLFRTTMGVLAANAATGALTILGITGGAAVALGWGAVRVADGDLELRALLIVLMLGVEIFRPLRELVQLYHDGVMAMSSAEGIFAIMDSPVSVRSPERAQASGAAIESQGAIKPEISFENVSHSYSEGRRPALRDLSFTLQEGEALGLVGPSGAGKSTIVWLMLRFFDPQQGVIRLGGRDLRDIPLDELREQMSVVTQDTYLFHGTVADNLRFGNPDATQAQLEDAARAANAHEFISHLLNGYDTVVGERAVRLSGGQKQRIAIARALLKDAPILILDEALSSVDAENEAIIQEALDRLVEGRTTLRIAHRLSSVVNADRILVLDNGRLAETGNHEELVSAGGLYAELMSQQQERLDFDVRPPEESYDSSPSAAAQVDVSAFIPQAAHQGDGHHHHAAPQAHRRQHEDEHRQAAPGHASEHHGHEHPHQDAPQTHHREHDGEHRQAAPGHASEHHGHEHPHQDAPQTHHREHDGEHRQAAPDHTSEHRGHEHPHHAAPQAHHREHDGEHRQAAPGHASEHHGHEHPHQDAPQTHHREHDGEHRHATQGHDDGDHRPQPDASAFIPQPAHGGHGGHHHDAPATRHHDEHGHVAGSHPIGIIKVWVRLLGLVKPWRNELILTFLLGVAHHGTAIGVGVVSALLVGQVITGGELGLLLILLGVLTPLAAFFIWTESWVAHDLAYRLLAEMRVDVYRKLDPLAPAYMTRRRSGDLVSVVGGDVETVEFFFAHTITPAFTAVVVPAVVVAVLAVIAWPMALAVAPFLVAVALSPFFAQRRSERLGEELRHQLGDVHAHMVDSIQGMREIVAFGRGSSRTGEMVANSWRFAHFQLRFLKERAFQIGFIEAMTALGGLVVLTVGVWLLTNDVITRPELILAVILSVAAFAPVSDVARTMKQLMETLAASRRLFAIHDEPVPVTDGHGVRQHHERQDHHDEHGHDREDGPRPAPSVVFEGVGFDYGPGEPQALREVSFEVGPGRTVALVGRSGAGKTTCANLAMRFWDPASGSVQLDGHDIREFKLDDLRQQIALVSQDTYLFNASIRDNIMLGRPDATDAELEAAARQANCHDFIAVFPDGYDTVVGERGMQLSGGQRQRIAIARALLKNAPVLILDEATSHLDAVSEGQLRQALENLMQGRTTLVIAHRLSTIRNADRIVVLDHGEAIEQGNHQELLERHGLYAQLVATQLVTATNGSATHQEEDRRHHAREAPLPAEWTGSPGGHHHNH